jgi:ElaB/YqjD/DUF883 family membrane-anchored ribosome-binding protein
MSSAPEETGTGERNDLRKAIASLKADMASLRDDLKRTGEHAAGRARAEARTAKDALEARMQATANSMEQQVLERPLTSVALAFGVGLLVGKLWRCG